MSDELPPAYRVLVIDDDPDLQVLVGMLLDRLGVKSTPAETAVEGLRLLQEAPYDLVILDLMLPDMDGFDLLAVLRKDEALNTLPVLILSARADPDAISRGLELGADGYLTKPYLPHSLTSRVKEMLAQGRQRGLGR